MTMATLGSATAEYGIRQADEDGRAMGEPEGPDSLDHLNCAAGHRFPIAAA